MIVPPQKALTTLETAKQLLVQTRGAFPSGTQFQAPLETAAALDRFAYDLDSQEPHAFAKFLAMSNASIFRVLPYSAYHYPLNTLQN